jgi:hypothetical protein
MNLQTSIVPAVENCESIPNSYDIKLLGPHSPYGPDNSFSKVFNKDSKFYYRIEQSNKNALVQYEVGIGYLEDNILKRFRPLYHGTPTDPAYPSSNGPQFFAVNTDDQLIVSSYIPQMFNEALCDPHTIVTSIAPFVPHPVALSENSFLGRLDDNVQSIPFSALFDSKELVNLILNTIVTYANQLSLNASKLDAKRISTESLQLNITNKPLAKKGALSFDGENLKYYDGEKYRVLQWRFED